MVSGAHTRKKRGNFSRFDNAGDVALYEIYKSGSLLSMNGPVKLCVWWEGGMVDFLNIVDFVYS